MSVSQSVTLSYTKLGLVERSTDRNLPPIFAKLATNVESRDVWLSIVFNPKDACTANRKWK